MGVGSSLIYAPANFAETPELIALASEAGRCGGMYISHIRDEGPKLIEAIDELVEISEKSGAPAEIYHFKQSGRDNWHKIDAAIARVEAARARGLRITADMYTYPASSTGFDAAMPLWIQAGGIEQWVKRLKDPAHAGKGAGRDAAAGRIGEYQAGGRGAGQGDPGRVQDRGAEAADRQDAGRGRAGARQAARGSGRRPDRRRRHAASRWSISG